MSQASGFTLSDVLELMGWLDAGLSTRGVGLLVKDERGETLFVASTLTAAFGPGSTLGLRERLAQDEPRVLAGQSVECWHDAGGVRCHCQQIALQLTCGARLIVALVIEAPSPQLQPLSQQRQLYDAREDERRRLATQMHDTLAQTLTSLSMHAEVLSGVIQHGIEEARLMLHRLRPPELASSGLEAALRSLLVQAKVEGRVLSDRNPGEVRLPDVQGLALYRMVEALLEPAVRADPPWRVQVLITSADSAALQLEVQAAGERLVLDPGRVRLLAEPVEAIGGRFDVISLVAGRAVVRATLNRF